MQPFSKYVFGTEEVRRLDFEVAAGLTDSALIPAIPGKKIVVLSVAFLCGSTATDATFTSDGIPITPTFHNAANGGAVLGHNPLGWFETEEGAALMLTTGSGSETGVLINYTIK